MSMKKKASAKAEKKPETRTALEAIDLLRQGLIECVDALQERLRSLDKEFGLGEAVSEISHSFEGLNITFDGGRIETDELRMVLDFPKKKSNF